MFATQYNIPDKLSNSLPRKNVAFNLNKKGSISARDITDKLLAKSTNAFLSMSPYNSNNGSVKKIQIPHNKLKLKQENDPLLLYSPLMTRTPPPQVFKKFLDGEVNQCQILQQQLRQGDEKFQRDVNKRKPGIKRGKTIVMRNRTENDEYRQSKLTVLQKFIQQKILNKHMRKPTIQVSKRSQIIDIIQEQKPINLSSNVRKLKQMQILYVPKMPLEQDNETMNYQKLKFFNDSDDFLEKLEKEKLIERFDKISKSSKRLVRKIKRDIKGTQQKNADYYPNEQSCLKQQDAVLYNYLREQNCLRRNSIFARKLETTSSQSSRKSNNSRQRQPLKQQVIKNLDNSDDECTSADLSLQSVYEYFLDDLYNEQIKLEQKLNLQQTFHVKLDKQMKTVNKIKNINQRVVDCSLHKLFSQ